jgi:hypothetical protein
MARSSLTRLAIHAAYRIGSLALTVLGRQVF